MDRACICGHIVLFEHGDLVVAKNVLMSLDELQEVIHVYFVGPKRETDHIMEKMMGTFMMMG